jgi:hypothetical protein
LVATDTPRTPEVWSKSPRSSGAVQALHYPLRLSGVHFPCVPEFLPRIPLLLLLLIYVLVLCFNDLSTVIFILSQCLADDLMERFKIHVRVNFWLFNDIISTKYFIELKSFTTLLNTMEI